MVYNVFNASHDEALAFGGENFTPSSAARLIDSDLALLPYWYAPQGEAVLVADAAAARSFLDALPVGRDVVPVSDFSAGTPQRIEPWGWNKALVRSLVHRGVSRDVMPGDDYLDLIRRLQSRETVSACLPRLYEALAADGDADTQLFAGSSQFVRSVAALHASAAYASGRYILKKPWSGSGRGLFISSDSCEERADKWCAAAVAEQGGVEVQALLDNAGDCAVEFSLAPCGEAVVTGYSDFSTARGGAYAGNTVKPHVDNDIRASLGSSAAALDAAVRALRRVLPEAHAGYRGAVGVDMMICRDAACSGALRLFPLVEINLRRTMGMVSVALAPLAAPGSAGRYRVVFERKPGRMKQRADRWRREHPLTLCGAQIAEGYLPLTPVNDNTHFHACVIFAREEIRE